jgi:sugar phosphate isomerase/epimerase
LGPLLYNTNGFAFHRLEDAARILADLGYDGIALTPDVHHLDPLRATAREVAAFGSLLERLHLKVVIETGARFVLDPARKHRPSLLDPPDEAARRLAFLERCVDLAADLGAPVASTWSGNGPPGQPRAEAMARLADGLRRLCDHAASRRVRVGFEPEPGMAVERGADWPAVKKAVGHPALGLALDVGHCLATREGDPAAFVRTHRDDLVVLQLDDHRPGVHDHLAFGEGEVDFGSVARAVRETGFAGPLEVELSRHSATAPETARASLAFLRRHFVVSRTA